MIRIGKQVHYLIFQKIDLAGNRRGKALLKALKGYDIILYENVQYASVPEWSKGADLSPAIFGCVGSNPT